MWLQVTTKTWQTHLQGNEKEPQIEMSFFLLRKVKIIITAKLAFMDLLVAITSS